MSEHAYLPPSGAHAWVHCAVWPKMSQRFPEADSPESAEGTAAHWVCVEARAGREPAPGTRAPNGVAVTNEMLEGADVWMRATGPADAQDHTEQRVGHAPGVLNWGTPDLWRLSPGWLDVWDYKFGHEHVEVFENWQLTNYAELIRDELGINGVADQQLQVRLHVVQPRSYHRDGPVRTWTVGPLSNLRAAFNILNSAAARAVQPEPVAAVGTHCKHCPGRHACQALHRNALAAVDYAGHATPIELPPEALGHELRALDRAAALLDARRTGLQAQAMAVIKQGQRVPFYAVEPGQSRERWTRPPAEVLAVAEAMEVKGIGRTELVTPAQARELGLDPSLVAAFSERPPGAVRLVADDGSKARRAFSN